MENLYNEKDKDENKIQNLIYQLDFKNQKILEI